jgi:hypothetical protein
MFTIGKATDFDLTSVEFSLAQDPKPLIIERIPAPESILATQSPQSIFSPEVRVHCRAEIACALG